MCVCGGGGGAVTGSGVNGGGGGGAGGGGVCMHSSFCAPLCGLYLPPVGDTTAQLQSLKRAPLE